MTSRPAARPPHIFFSCGEASGDRYGAALAAVLRRRCPDLRLSALGGSALAAAGATIVQPNSPLAVMGFGEVLGALPALFAARRRVWRHLAAGGVDLCVPVDYPGFNLRVAGRARALGIPVFYLVAPQLWAWGAWRLNGVRRAVDRLGVILPFESEWFTARGIDVVALGHPLVEDYPAEACAQAAAQRESRLAAPGRPLTLGLLPGSRPQEVHRLLPDLLGAARLLRDRLAPRRLNCVVSAAPGIEAGQVAALLDGLAEVSTAPLPRLLPRLDLAIVCSGTASLEVALAGVPHEIVFRTSAFSYLVARRLIRVRAIGLANLVLDQALVPEHLQGAIAPAPLASALEAWVAEQPRRQTFADGVARLRARLGPPGVWERAADAVLELLAQHGAGRGAARG